MKRLLLALALALTGCGSSAAPKPTILVIPGGGWVATTGATERLTAPTRKRFEAWGYRTVFGAYGAGRGGEADILRLVDAQLKASGGRLCLYGESAGGHWALLAAEQRPQVRCVVALAAPTDLVDLPQGSPLDELVAGALGEPRLPLSPLQHHAQLTSPTLLGYGLTDPAVPSEQGALLHLAVPGSTFTTLPSGDAPFVHSGVAAGPLAALVAQERAFFAAHLRP